MPRRVLAILVWKGNDPGKEVLATPIVLSYIGPRERVSWATGWVGLEDNSIAHQAQIPEGMHGLSADNCVCVHSYLKKEKEKKMVCIAAENCVHVLPFPSR